MKHAKNISVLLSLLDSILQKLPGNQRGLVLEQNAAQYHFLLILARSGSFCLLVSKAIKSSSRASVPPETGGEKEGEKGPI